MAAGRPVRRSELGWGDRLCLQWTAWTFAALAAVVLVATAGAVGVWWQVAGREGITDGGRTWPAVAGAVLGSTAAVALYGVSRLCRAVTRLCAAATAAEEPTTAASRVLGRPHRARPATPTGRGTLARHA